MKAGTLLRIGIYLIGVWAFFSALITGTTYLYDFIRFYRGDVASWARDQVPNATSHFFLPLGFALATVAFGDRFSRMLLGGRADETLAALELSQAAMLSVGLKFLGVYCLVDYVPGAVSSLFELFARAIKDRPDNNIVAMRDLLYYVAGAGAGLFLCLKTRLVLDKILVEPERPRA